jgi:hypothetical protein
MRHAASFSYGQALPPVHEVLHALLETRAIARDQPWGWFAVASLRDGRAAIRFRGV